MDALFCENIIIKLLFNNEQMRDRILYYVTPDIFDDFCNIDIMKVVKGFTGKFEKFPTLAEMKLEIPNENSYNRLISNLNINIGEYSFDYLLSECEYFIRRKKTINNFAECSNYLKEAKFEEARQYPDKIRESLSFSFNTALGLDFLEDEERMYNFLHNADRTVPFGISFLDRNTKGGAHEKSLTFFMAESNLGKTLILSSLAANNVRANKKVLYITCEMAENKISERILSNIWDHDINELDIINREAFHNRYEEMRRTIQGKLQIKEFPPSTINPNDIRNLLKDYVVKKKFIPDIIYLDYLELVKPSYMRKSDNSYTECKRTAEEVRAIGCDEAIPFVSALQTNRDGYGAAESSLKHTADSMGLIMTGDIVVGVTQSPELLEAGKFSLKFLKNRYGLNKIKGIVNVDKFKMRISDCDDEQEAMNTLRRNAPTSPLPNAMVQEALNAMSDTLTKAHETTEESLYGDWE